MGQLFARIDAALEPGTAEIGWLEAEEPPKYRGDPSGKGSVPGRQGEGPSVPNGESKGIYAPMGLRNEKGPREGAVDSIDTSGARPCWLLSQLTFGDVAKTKHKHAQKTDPGEPAIGAHCWSFN